MEFINHTPFPALAFQMLDWDEDEYHVVVMRATLDINDNGTLQPSEEQVPLAVADECFGEMNISSVRQESDLAPFKPNCDIIVNATACAPGGKPASSFDAGIRINGNSGKVLLEKILTVTGPRYWRETGKEWQISEPGPITYLPLRYEYAYGGESRICLDDPAAERLDSSQLLTPEQRAQHPEGPDHAPAAHTACETNPIGMGFTEPWYVKVTGVKEIPAPQIESPDDPVKEFGKHYTPQGFGLITRAWQPRLKLAGTYDKEWLDSIWPNLPEDFDFAYWNCAHPEMQVPYLKGDETIALTNMTPDGKLSFTLPGHTLYILVRFETGEIGPAPAHLDTLIIAPDRKLATLVWRTTVAVEPEVRVLEARLICKEVTDELSTAVREAING